MKILPLKFSKRYLLLLLIVFFLALFFAPDFYISFGTDYGVYLNIGNQITKGFIPYQDIWDHKFPLFSYFLALLQVLFGSNWLSLKLFIVITYIISAICFVFFSNCLLRSRKWSIAAGFLYLFYITRLDIDSARNGSILVFGLIFIFFSLYYLYIGYKLLEETTRLNKQILLNFGASGFLGGLAFLTRQTFIEPAIIGTILITLALIRHSSKRKNLLLTYLIFFMGYLLSVIPFLTYIIYKADFSNFYKCTILYNIDYARYFTHWGALARNSIVIFKKTFLFWIVILIYLIYKIIDSYRVKLSRNFFIHNIKLNVANYTILCLLVSLFIYLITKGRHLFYSFEFLPFLILASIVSLRLYVKDLVSISTLRFKSIILSPIIVVGLMVLFISIDSAGYFSSLFKSLTYLKKNNFSYKSYPDVAISELAKELSKNNNIPQKMFVAGSRSVIYTLSGFDAPFYSYIPSVNYKTIIRPPDVLKKIMDFNPYIIVDWNYKDYFIGADKLTKYIQDNYEVVKRFDCSFNYPYQKEAYATLYKRKSS